MTASARPARKQDCGRVRGGSARRLRAVEKVLLAALALSLLPSPLSPLPVAAAGAASGAPPSQPAGGPAPLVLEGFEKLNRVRTWPDKLEAVTEGEGVTEEKQAARFPGGQTVLVKVRGEECTRYGWLKFDVLTLQPLSHPFRIYASGPNWARMGHAYAQAGKDTVAMPLAQFFRPGDTPDEVEISLTNASDRSVIVDNLRFEPAAAPPPGCQVLDFGPDGHVVWPGFTGAPMNCPRVVWSGKVGIGQSDYRVPDLLSGSFMGPWPGSKVSETFELVAPERNSTAWLWITHYADHHAQPMEYVLSFGGKALAQRRLTREQLLGSESLMEGMGGEWTPKWFDSVYAARLTEVVRLGLTDLRSPVAIGNCQLAAMALAPPAGKQVLAAYVAQVQADQARYRRQFVVGMRNDPRCELNPGEADANAGLILFCPPAEDVFLSGWKPKESDRAEKVSVLVGGGLLAAVPFAIAPLKKTSVLTATVGPLHAADGRNLACEKDSPDVLFCKTVPRVLEARADQQPWLLSRKNPPAGERQLVWMVLKIEPTAEAKSGVYQGAIRVNVGGATAQIPLEVQVISFGPESKDVATLGIFHNGHAAAFYTPLVTDDMSDAMRDGLRAKTCQQLLETGNALTLPSAFVNGDFTVADGGLIQQLKDYPVRSARGWTLLDCQQALDSLRGIQPPPGPKQVQQAAGALVAKTAAAAGRAGLRDYHFVLGTFFDPGWMPDRIRLATAIQSAGGSAALLLEDNWLSRTPKDQVQAALAAPGAAIFVNYQKNLAAWVDAYRKAHPGGRAYVYSDRPDRLAGGLFAAAMGLDGAYYNGAAMRGGTYSGFFLDGSGILALESDGTLVPTIASLWLQQAQADFLLVRRSEELLAAAATAKADVPELAKTLQDLKAAMAGRYVSLYDYQLMRSSSFTRTEIESWRKRLMESCGKAWAILHP